VRFFALDSNYVDDKQLAWLDKELAASGSDWKICFFHHPLYSSGETHGSAELQRGLLEPVFLKYGVNVVLSGHEHFYERIKPQKGIYYFTQGGGAKLRDGDIENRGLTAVGFDTDRSFSIVEIAAKDFSFQTIDRLGKTVDKGTIARQDMNATVPAAAPAGRTGRGGGGRSRLDRGVSPSAR
jgi:3',5'-cyclic AMP phosphodiesterase CpdA